MGTSKGFWKNKNVSTHIALIYQGIGSLEFLL